jgi:tRNA A-37 threonylcarbamoyl transferase component Bud32
MVVAPYCLVEQSKLFEFLEKLTGKSFSTEDKLRMLKLDQRGTLDANMPCKLLTEYLPSRCLGGWEITKILGHGAFGIAFLVQQGNKARAAKVSIENPDKKNTGWMSPEREIEFQTVAANASIAPRIYCQDRFRKHNMMIHVTTMEKVDLTVSDYLKKIEEQYPGPKDKLVRKQFVDAIWKGIGWLFYTLKQLNMRHGDMHTDNLMVKFMPDGSIKIMLIDFGFSSMGAPEEAVDYDVSQFLYTLGKHFDDSRFYDYFRVRLNKFVRYFYKRKVNITDNKHQNRRIYEAYKPYIGEKGPKESKESSPKKTHESSASSPKKQTAKKKPGTPVLHAADFSEGVRRKGRDGDFYWVRNAQWSRSSSSGSSRLKKQTAKKKPGTPVLHAADFSEGVRRKGRDGDFYWVRNARWSRTK